MHRTRKITLFSIQSRLGEQGCPIWEKKDVMDESNSKKRRIGSDLPESESDILSMFCITHSSPSLDQRKILPCKMIGTDNLLSSFGGDPSSKT